MRLTDQNKLNDLLRTPAFIEENIEKHVKHKFDEIEGVVKQGNQQLALEVQEVRERILKGAKDRDMARNEIERIGEEVRRQRVLDEVKRRELQMVLLGRRKRGDQPEGRLRTRIPDDYQKEEFRFPEPPRPFRHRVKEVNFYNKEELQQEPPLKTRAKFVEKHIGKQNQHDYYNEEKVARCIQDIDRGKYPQFYNKMEMGIKLSSEFPSLPDDIVNKQNLIVPRMEHMRYDDQDNYLDLHHKNIVRLNALDGKRISDFDELEGKNGERLVKKVDRIVDALENYRKQYGNGYEDEQPKKKRETTIFNRNGSRMIATNSELQNIKVGEDSRYYTNKNPIDEQDYFKEPQKYKNWDSQFNAEDYV